MMIMRTLSNEDRERFDRALEAILAELPEDVHALLRDIPIVVDDEPSRALLREMGTPCAPGEPADLCGLHSGVPLSARSVSDPALLPDQIQLFRGPILRLADESDPSDDELKTQVRITLLHELGHHFGFDEDELDELGYA